MYCFDKTRRLLTKSEFDNVFNQAKKVITTDFVILYRDNIIGHSRLGLALSKKIVFKAHERNRIKRMLRESFRKCSLPAIDVVVLMRRRDDNAGINKVKLEKMWDKLCLQ